MMMALFDQETQDRLRENEIIANSLAEGIGIGEARGEARGSFNMLAVLVKDGIVSKEYAAGKLGITVEEFDKRVLAIRE